MGDGKYKNLSDTYSGKGKYPGMNTKNSHTARPITRSPRFDHKFKEGVRKSRKVRKTRKVLHRGA